MTESDYDGVYELWWNTPGMFLTQALAVNGFPFQIRKISANPYGVLSEDEMLNKLEKAREHAEQGMYKDAYAVSHDMRAKYGI